MQKLSAQARKRGFAAAVATAAHAQELGEARGF